VLGRSRGDGNVVIRRVLPTGKGERPSSHAPKPEDKNRGRGRPTWDSFRDGPHERGFSRPLTQAQGKGGETSLTAGLTSLSTREGERSRRTRKAFVGRQRRKREPRGGPERWLTPSKGIPLREDLVNHRSNRGVRRDFGHRREGASNGDR